MIFYKNICWNYNGLSYTIFHDWKLNTEDIEYHIPILHDELNFDWSTVEFKYQDEPIFFHL